MSDAFVSMLSSVLQSSSRRFAASVSLDEARAHSLGSMASTRGFCGLKHAISPAVGAAYKSDCEMAGEAAGFEIQDVGAVGVRTGRRDRWIHHDSKASGCKTLESGRRGFLPRAQLWTATDHTARLEPLWSRITRAAWHSQRERERRARHLDGRAPSRRELPPARARCRGTARVAPAPRYTRSSSPAERQRSAAAQIQIAKHGDALHKNDQDQRLPIIPPTRHDRTLREWPQRAGREERRGQVQFLRCRPVLPLSPSILQPEARGAPTTCCMKGAAPRPRRPTSRSPSTIRADASRSRATT